MMMEKLGERAFKLKYPVTLVAGRQICSARAERVNMSKAILVMDMPESCCKCDLRVIGSVNFCTGADGRTIDQMKIINEDIKPDWCPLKKLPEFINISGCKTEITKARAQEYNALLARIINQAETSGSFGWNEGD